MIVLPGWGQNSSFWENFAAKFSKIQVFDLPGFGSQPAPARTWGVPDYADWVETEIKAHAENDVVLLGHSFGGRVAGYLASKKPVWLKGLILHGAPCLYRPTLEIKLKIKAAQLLKRIGFSPIGPIKSSELKHAEQAQMGEIFRKVVNFDETDILPKVAVPTLLVWGKHDQEVPLRIAEEMQHLIKSSKLTVIENAGHNLHLEKPDLFYGIVKKFIESI